MPKVRKEIPELEKLVQVGRKKLSVMRKGHNYILWGCIHFRISERCKSSLSCEESCSG